MDVYVVWYSDYDGFTVIHSVHCSEWMADLTAENHQKKDREIATWSVSKVRLTAERD